MKVNKKDKVINLRRTLCIDRVRENYNRVMYANPKDILDDKEFMKHMDSNVRVANSDTGEFVWLQKTSRPDHFLLAEGYGDLAYELTMGSNIFDVYKDIVAETEAKEIKTDVGSKLEDDLDKLPEKERERIEAKKNVNANDFFKELQQNSIL